MTEIETRWPCPVCLGVKLEKVPAGPASDLTLDHCPRCGGIWFELGEVQALRAAPPETLWERIERLEEPHHATCHSCRAVIDRDVERCPVCQAENLLDCPRCDRATERAIHGALTLDVCRRCRGVWFDHHELDAVWTLERDKLVARRRGGRLRRRSSDATDVLLGTLVWAPDLLFYGAYAAGHVTASAIEGLADAAPAAAEAVGEAAASVFETIVEILGGIFS
jgi:Zn-finger nucleic acid-binding protein